MSKAVFTRCGIVEDLLPLYIDKCCSEESIEAVESHLEECPHCKAVFDSMCCENTSETKAFKVPENIKKINSWKASVLQSVLLFVSFAVLAVGITLEAYTPYSITNGIWAFTVIVPVSGFMLSLSNWYFVKMYKNTRVFSTFSSLITLGISILSYVWAVLHFRTTFFELSGSLVMFLVLGFVITGVLCIASKIVSGIYARMLGKE